MRSECLSASPQQSLPCSGDGVQPGTLDATTGLNPRESFLPPWTAAVRWPPGQVLPWGPKSQVSLPVSAPCPHGILGVGAEQKGTEGTPVPPLSPGPKAMGPRSTWTAATSLGPLGSSGPPTPWAPGQDKDNSPWWASSSLVAVLSLSAQWLMDVSLSAETKHLFSAPDPNE